MWVVVAVSLAGCARKPPPVEKPAPAAQAPGPARPRATGQIGLATYYANRFTGRKTASGERYHPNKMTAAHLRLPFGTVVRVVRLDEGGAPMGEPVTVRVNDRGPYGGRGRIIDVSMAAAKRLNMLKAGVVRVRVEVLKAP
jgi:rare lipoprotein A